MHSLLLKVNLFTLLECPEGAETGLPERRHCILLREIVSTILRMDWLIKCHANLEQNNDNAIKIELSGPHKHYRSLIRFILNF